MIIFESDHDRIIWQLKCKLSDSVDDLGQSSVAEIIGTSQSAISRALNQEYKPKMGTLVRWFKSLGYSVEFTVTKS